MTLHGRATEQEIDLVIVVPVPTQILDNAHTGLTIGNCRVKEMLLAIMVDAEPFERQITPGSKLGLYRAWMEDGRLHAHLCHSVLNHVEFDGDHTGHLDGTAERDFAVPLGEVKVPDGELSARDVDGEVDLAAATEVLDVTVPTVLGAALVYYKLLMSAGMAVSRTGIVRAPSLATFSLISALALPACVFLGSGGLTTTLPA